MKARKHQLLATSALATAAMALPGVAAAEMMKPALSVSGYFWHDTHFASQDMDEDKSSVLHHVDSEVHFKMGGELDNGLKISGQVELEGQTAGDQIDETKLVLSGAWGMVRLGTTNSGRYNHSFSVGGPNVAHGVSSGVQTEWFVFPKGTGGFAFRKPLGSAHPDISNDDPAITYFTPRFNGFQLSLTHRPEIQDTGGTNIGTSGSDESENYTNALDGSVEYSGDMGGMKVALVLGGATADGPMGHEDYQIVNGGAKISASGFSFGGHMADVEDDMNQGTGKAYVVGASYGQGPWAVSATFHDGEVSHTTTKPVKYDITLVDTSDANPPAYKVKPATRGYADDPATAEMSVWSVGMRYTLSPGVRLLASYQNAEVTVDSSVAATDASNEGSAFTLGFAVNF